MVRAQSVLKQESINQASGIGGYSAYIDTGRYAICSASPELFFRFEGDPLTCKPMKGTVRRGRTLDEDKSLADWLQSSEKNRAENLMIVDMIRNDLGRVADVGSVQVPAMFEVERHPTPLADDVHGHCAAAPVFLGNNGGAISLCIDYGCAQNPNNGNHRRTGNGGSRHLYGMHRLFGSRWNRSIQCRYSHGCGGSQYGQVEYGSGGGIVWDSACKDEYTEALLKARVLTEQRPEFSLLETMLWTPDESYFLLDYHLRVWPILQSISAIP